MLPTITFSCMFVSNEEGNVDGNLLICMPDSKREQSSSRAHQKWENLLVGVISHDHMTYVIRNNCLDESLFVHSLYGTGQGEAWGCTG